jgi:Serine dehydrogenase proteinase
MSDGTERSQSLLGQDAPPPVDPVTVAPNAAGQNTEGPAAISAPSPPEEDPFDAFKTGDRKKIAPVLAAMFAAVLAKHLHMRDYCLLAIFDQHTSITNYELDRIYNGLKAHNADRQKDVLLLLMSTGGSIEPAYQISKLCKSFAKTKFIVCVPRYAKSAATLISLGADEVHMGMLGHLGPIDPQIGGLPALAIARALDTLAELVERHPASADMLASYLKEKLPVEQIGYYERAAESAVQYGQRLLETKHLSILADEPAALAHSLVHDYKDHGFVIDFEEATERLGAGWILRGTKEEAFAEAFYEMFDFAEYLARTACKKNLALIGSLDPADMLLTTFLTSKR